MAMKDDIKPVTWLKSKTAQVLEQINRCRRPVIITQNGQPRAVIQDPKSYEQMRAALAMLKLLAQSEQDIEKGRLIEQDEMFDRLEKRLAKKKPRKTA